MSDMPRCRDCRFWDPLDDALSFGACERMEAMPGGPPVGMALNEVRMRALHDFDGKPVLPEEGDHFSIAIATGSDFGCVLWEAKPDA